MTHLPLSFVGWRLIGLTFRTGGFGVDVKLQQISGCSFGEVQCAFVVALAPTGEAYLSARGNAASEIASGDGR